MNCLKILGYFLILLHSINISYAQLECPECPKLKLISMEKIIGPFGCDPKVQETLCKEVIFVERPGVVFGSQVSIYCRPIFRGNCPNEEICWKMQLRKYEDNTIIEAYKILEKKNFNKKDLSILKNLSKEEAKKVALAINKIDVTLLRNFPAKDIAQIEEFKSLSLEQQANIIIKPMAKYMGALAAGGFMAATYAAQQTAKAYRDSLFGGDHFKENKKIQEEKQFNEKQFDLKN